MEQGNLPKLAKIVGGDWKAGPYYQEAEQVMEIQWKELIWPFIRDCDFSCVVDLAAGHGRNSEWLKTVAEKIYIVDINAANIRFCKTRFVGDPRFTFIQNDGVSLEGIPNRVVSLLYCFDAMVHFDSDVVRAYLKEFGRILKRRGHGFVHHSNYTRNPGGSHRENPGWRNYMSESLFAHYCVKEGLKVVRSQVLDWSGPESDCLTLVQKP